MTERHAADDREIADLLPFYAAGTLDVRDAARVAAALQRDPALRRELDLARDEREAAIAGSEALGVPSRRAYDRLLAGLDAAPPRQVRRLDLAGWLGARAAALAPRTLAWSALALAGIILAQGVVIGLGARHRTTFAVASVPAPSTPSASSGTLFIVSFAPTARAGAIATLLQSVGATITAGPMAGGLYELRVGDRALDGAGTQTVIDKLTADATLVTFAAREQSAD